MECSFCHTENRVGSRFCSSCGNPLSTSPENAGIDNLIVGSRLLGGRYTIKRILGQGGMGTALLATDNRINGKLVVIKELISNNTNPTHRADDIRNFRREVAMLSLIVHPLVPSVTDQFQEGDLYFIVQSYVDGENLEQQFDRNGQRPLDEALLLRNAVEILDVLEYLSRQSPPIIHRDIKPSNIIIGTQDRRAHLVDFGIARAETILNARRKQTTALGTPGYAPPEQYQGNADARSDLYGLAATLHHVLTGRDPRNYPPFEYPPARALNPSLDVQTEQILQRALQREPLKRYASAYEMRQDVEQVLNRRFGTGASSNNYIFGASDQQQGPDGGGITKGGWIQNSSSLTPPLGAFSQPGLSGKTVMPPRKPLRNRVFVLVLATLLILSVIIFSLYALRANGNSTSGSITTPGSGPDALTGIGVVKARNGEMLGVSDGQFPFDTNRADGDLKKQAAERIKAHDSSAAESFLQGAIDQDSSDPEAHIYLEDQKVLASGQPYITIVAGTFLTGSNLGVGRDNLQGAFVMQQEANAQRLLPGGVLVNLLIANSGSTAGDVQSVAKQIVNMASKDSHLVAVLGWPFSSRAINAGKIFTQAHLPMVSQTATSDLLTGFSPYVFRIAPTNKQEAIVGAKYAETSLHATKVALFSDPADSYSSNLANDFKQQFAADGNAIVDEEQYTVGKPGTLPGSLEKALKTNPDIIYFSGYSPDISTLLIHLPTEGPGSKVQIMGGDALYELNGYPKSARAGFLKLHFTALAYPDAWKLQGKVNPAFFEEYAQAYDPQRRHQDNPYGFTRPASDVILSYDGLKMLLTGCGQLITDSHTTIVREDLRKTLASITGDKAIQGVSGRLSFGGNGDPQDKAVVILRISPEGYVILEGVRGQFFL